MPSLKTTPKALDQKTLERIALGLDGLRFGILEIVVHDSKVVRLVRSEKVRMDEPDPSTKTGTTDD